MKLDSSSSHSTADEIKHFQIAENNDFPEGRHISEPDRVTGSVVEKCTEANIGAGRQVNKNTTLETSLPWCYLFVHHRKVKAFEAQLGKDQRRYFIHTSFLSEEWVQDDVAERLWSVKVLANTQSPSDG